jgi:hypothetical protein
VGVAMLNALLFSTMQLRNPCFHATKTARKKLRLVGTTNEFAQLRTLCRWKSTNLPDIIVLQFANKTQASAGSMDLREYNNVNDVTNKCHVKQRR